MNRFALLLASAALAACSSLHVATDHDPKADFGKLRAYSWMAREKSDNPVVDNTLVVNRIKGAIDRELAAKGFRRADGGSPDFVVDFATATRDVVDVHTWPSWCSAHCGHGFSGWQGGHVDVVEYVQGTIAVGMIDPATNELLWRGTATRALEEDSGSEKRIDEAMKALFAEFPPGAKQAATSRAP